MPPAKLSALNSAPPKSTHCSAIRGYTDRDLEIFKKFVVSPGTPEPGFITDSLGVRTRVTALPDSLHGRAGDTIGLPVPEDTYHAEAIEYIGLLKSVAAARHRYTALELGAGWGALAGGRRPRRQTHRDQRHPPLRRGGRPRALHFPAAALPRQRARPGPTHDPQRRGRGRARHGTLATGSKSANNTWGMRPARQGSEADTSYLENSGASAEHYRNIEVLPIAELLQREEHWELVHIDIQGWEAAVCQAGLPLLTERTKYVVVGTHSRKLDGDVLQLFWKAGWVLENEKPTRFHFSADGRELENMTEVDGAQVWMNPTL